MGALIDEINREIDKKTISLIGNIDKNLLSVKFEGKTNVDMRDKNNVPSRPFYLLSGLLFCIIVMKSVSIGEFFSLWNVLFFIIACISFFCGYIKQKKHDAKYTGIDNTIDYDFIKSQLKSVADEVISLTNKDWNQFMDGIKLKVQDGIKDSSLNEEAQNAAMLSTYMYETLDLNTGSIINAINDVPENSLFANNMKKVVGVFLESCKNQILSAAEKQKFTYKKINI